MIVVLKFCPIESYLFSYPVISIDFTNNTMYSDQKVFFFFPFDVISSLLSNHIYSLHPPLTGCGACGEVKQQSGLLPE